MKKDYTGKKRKSRRARRRLGVAFAAVVVAGGGGAYAAQQHSNPPPNPGHSHHSNSSQSRSHQKNSSKKNISQNQSNPSSAPGPGIIQVFGVTATRAPLSDSPYASHWDAMLVRQQYYLKNSQNARQYSSFLAQFDQYRGEPLMQMATNVNALVQKEITYTDDTNCTIPDTDAIKCNTIDNGADYFWRSPVETALYGKGNCLNQATLQYFIMRYLGVPADRLFIADVNAYGQQTAGPDHTILLLNIVSAGEPLKLVIMNDVTPVIPANDALVERTWLNGSRGGSKSDYVLYDAFNEANSWLTKYASDDYITAPGKQASPSALPGKARFSLKIS
jgi:predicted transglutaminase-like cysteine proteinase